MNSTKTKFSWFFSVLVIADLLCGHLNFSAFRFITKPLILIALLSYFVWKSGGDKDRSFYLMAAALLCSLLGDIFLLFETRSGLFFVLGLASFLTAHILFVLVFFKKWNRTAIAGFWLVVTILIGYGVALFGIMEKSLGELKVPVILYILAIMAMVITAYRRKNNVNLTSFNMVFMGAIFFVLSDSILALNKFVTQIPFAHILIMGTYASAQYLITMGILKQKKQ